MDAIPFQDSWRYAGVTRNGASKEEKLELSHAPA
jgi:hypothetical protein